MKSRIGVVVCSVLLASQLAACGGGGGSSAPPVSNNPPPSGNDNPSPPAPTKVSLKLKGTVTDAPIPNAVVTATVGSQTFTTTADANGVYSLDVEVEEGNVSDFVTLSGKGVGEQSYVEFRSLAGSFQSLVAAAGTDKELSSEESRSTQITNVSTAEAVLLQEANGGQPITSDAALAELGTSVDGQQVLDLAATIKLLVDHADDYPMPAGQTSILALATDAAARQTAIDEAATKDPAVFSQAQNAIAADPSLVRPLTAEDVEDFTAALLSSDPGFSFNYTNRVAGYTFMTDGTGSVSTGTSDAPMTWKVEGSTIRVTFNQPVETVSFDTENCVGDGGVRQVEAHYSTTELSLAFLSKRTVATTETSHVTYADCASLAARDVSVTSARTILQEEDALTLDIAELRDSTHSIYVFNGATQTVMADIADLKADGTGTTRLLNLSFTWQLDDSGRIVEAEFADGTTAEYLVLRDIDAVTSDLYFELRTPGGAVYTDIGASVYADPEYAVDLDAAAIPARYYQFGKGDETGFDARLKGFALRFNAGGTGSQELDYIDLDGNVVLEDETLEPSYAFHWTYENGEVVVRRTWDTVAQQDNCVYGTANCVIYDERRIIPIAADDDRIYWLERRRSSQTSINENTPATHLVRFYEREPLTGAASIGESSPSALTPPAPTRAVPRGTVVR
jgi:hypothetical protein